MQNNGLNSSAKFKYPLPEYVENNTDESWALKLIAEENKESSHQEDIIMVHEQAPTETPRLSAIEKQQMAWALKQNQCEENQVDSNQSTTREQDSNPFWQKYLKHLRQSLKV